MPGSQNPSYVEAKHGNVTIWAVLNEWQQAHPGQESAVFTHGGVVKAITTAIILTAAELPIDRSLNVLEVDNASITTIVHRKGRWRIRRSNERPGAF